jgi:ATP-dependent helicase HepA
MYPAFHPGQRWISDSEPELGLGAVLRVSDRTVTVVFRASGETRQYAADNAPLRRVRFRLGDSVRAMDNSSLIVESVTERGGLLHYGQGDRELCETDLSDAISFNQPQERLLAGQVDSTDLFDLRLAALRQQHRRRLSSVRGFVGGRIDLIPHQLSIAGEVTGRLAPRVLLADEVGLGKTIEACLILHRLIHTGRAARVLILVPESLLHQWFVELLRRFNLWFHIFDEDRCVAIQAANPEANPFLDDQLIVASLRLLSANDRRLEQALAAGWDLVVVDEAHHLGWTPEVASADYAAVEALGRRSPGLLLLTATPEQLGMTSHFARLRLLDPARFHDLEGFIQEAEGYREIASLADALLRDAPLHASEEQVLARILGDVSQTGLGQDSAGLAKIQTLRPVNRSAAERTALLSDLLDRHGTGRVMFRNTRAAVAGFPRRVARLHALDGLSNSAEQLDALAEEFAADADATLEAYFDPDFAADPRSDWLAELLRSLGDAKVLLLCRTQAKVEALESALRRRITVKMAVFHEGLPLVQRDRHAAWFAEEDGARLLLCSEIGGEGRNFQFAHHLVLFDLPLDPELLEQRIGRLDRIGQRNDIQMHVPFLKGSAQEVLARWFHEGLNSFEKNLQGGRELLERFGKAVHDLALEFHEGSDARPPDPQAARLSRLIAETVTARCELSGRLEKGRDRLLEMNSFRPEAAARLVQEIARCDSDADLEDFMLEVFDHFNIHVEQLAPRTYQLGSAGVFADSFPGLPTEGMTVTADRARALAREDIQFLTSDHPLVTGALDLLLGNEKGNCSVALWPDSKTAGLYLEAIYVLECIAPPPLHADRFLPPTPLRVLVDHRGTDAGGSLTTEQLRKVLKRGQAGALLDQEAFREDLFPRLLAATEALAIRPVADLISRARKAMAVQLDAEIARLKELQKVNRSVRPEEVTLLVRQRNDLDRHLAAARLRLDSIRLIRRGAG